MAEDPKPIESLLQAYAKKRRDDAGPPLNIHPATRRMLQGEARRVHGSGGAASQGKQRFHLWPRLAWGGFAISMLATVSLIWIQFFRETSPRREPAVSKTTPSVPALREAQPSAADSNEMLGRSDAPAEPTTIVADSEVRLQSAPAQRFAAGRSRGAQDKSEAAEGAGKELSDVNNVTLSLNRPAPAGPAASAPPGSTSGGLGGGAGSADRGLPRGEQREGDELKLADLGADAAHPLDGLQPKSGLTSGVHPAEAQSYLFFTGPPIVTNSAAANVGIVALNANLGNVDAYAYFKQAIVTQQFVQVNTRARLRENLQSPPVPAVLTSFRFIRNGNDLQVVDADGSTYTGKLVQEPALSVVSEALGETEVLKRQPSRSIAAPMRAAKLAAAPSSSAVTNNLHFRVEGTNQTINQRVLFEGLFVSNLTNVPAQAIAGAVVAGDETQNRGEAQAGLSNVAIEGSATIGGRERLRINAVPAQPALKP